jgi:hypothetical protein
MKGSGFVLGFLYLDHELLQLQEAHLFCLHLGCDRDLHDPLVWHAEGKSEKVGTGNKF